MAEHLHIDVETRSVADLRKTGVYVYAKHPTTDLWVACYRFDDGPIKVWRPGEPVPADIARHVKRGGVLVAHNAAFERIIWKFILTPRYGWPEPATSQWRCTMVQAYAMALPGALENALPAAGIDFKKDMSGHRLMLQMARPRKTKPERKKLPVMTNANREAEMNEEGWERYSLYSITPIDGTIDVEIQWWNTPEKVERLTAYCKVDVEAECHLFERLRPLKQSELELWWLDQEINDRGVFVDEELCHAAKKVVAETTARLDAEMREATGGEVTRCSNRNQIVKWLRENGVDTSSIAKSDIEDLLAEDPPENVRRVLLLRRESAKASVAKIDALLRGKCPDGRARGLCQFHAASTGRWAGRRFQPQNLKRPEMEEQEAIEQAIEMILSEDVELMEVAFGPPLSVVGDTIRGMIKAPEGRKIIAADYTSIEGVVLAWLAGETWKLDTYREIHRGESAGMYEITAGRILGKAPEDITKLERQNYGKVPELALGYQGGVGAFKKMGVNYGVDLPESQIIEIRDGWRAANPAIKQFWYDLNDAALKAVENPGTTHWVDDKLVFRMAGSFLFLRLPSKRFLAYAYPQIGEKKMPWKDDDGNDVYKTAVSYKGVNSYTRKWERNYLYGGHLAENATQAVARDFMADAMPRLEDAGYEIVLTVHDEVVSEVDKDFGSAEEMVDIMKTLPAWGEGCPIAADGWEGERYRK